MKIYQIPAALIKQIPVSMFMGIDPNKIVGVVQYMGGRQEFMEFAKNFVVQLGSYEKRKLAFADDDFAEKIENCTVVILGQVNGQLMNQILFVKDDEE